MIQRIQSLYLLLAAILVVLMGILNLATISNGETSVELFYWAVLGGEGAGVWLLTFSIPLTVVFFLFTIFQYKNRMLQLKLGRLNYLLLAAVVVGIYLTTSGIVDQMGEGAIQTRGVASYLPLGALILNFLAIRAITKDEKLVSSVDRLR